MADPAVVVLGCTPNASLFATPAVKVTVAVSVTVTLSVVSVAAKTTALAVVDFTVNVTTPDASLEPDAALIVGVPDPDVLASVTVFPDTGLLFASLSVTVTVDVVLPSAATELGEALTVDCTAVGVPLPSLSAVPAVGVLVLLVDRNTFVELPLSTIVPVPKAPPLFVTFPPVIVPVESVNASDPSEVVSLVTETRTSTDVELAAIVIPELAETQLVPLKYCRLELAPVSVPTVAVPLDIEGVNVLAALSALLSDTAKTT